MALFRDFDECKGIVSLMLLDFSEEGQKQIGNTIIYCQQLENDADKCFALTHSLKKQLWEIPKAVDVGFVKYLTERVVEIRLALNYYKVNENE